MWRPQNRLVSTSAPRARGKRETSDPLDGGMGRGSPDHSGRGARRALRPRWGEQGRDYRPGPRHCRPGAGDCCLRHGSSDSRPPDHQRNRAQGAPRRDQRSNPADSRRQGRGILRSFESQGLRYHAEQHPSCSPGWHRPSSMRQCFRSLRAISRLPADLGTGEDRARRRHTAKVRGHGSSSEADLELSASLGPQPILRTGRRPRAILVGIHITLVRL